MPLTVLHILQESEQRLADVDSPRLSAEAIVSHVLGCTRLTLVVDRDKSVSSEAAERIDALVERRAEGEPLAYLLGFKEFYGLDFVVSSDTLIPRPETEHVVEVVEELYGKDVAFRFADLGTGSGILAVVLAHLFPQATGVAVDLSPGALTVARRNAEAHGVSDRLDFRQADFTRPLSLGGIFDLIVSNPPYVPQQEYEDASHEVTGFEPATALVSGEDGLKHIRAMLPHVARALKSGGSCLMEIGYRQADAIKKIISRQFPEFGGVKIIKDLAGHDRVVFLQKL